MILHPYCDEQHTTNRVGMDGTARAYIEAAAKNKPSEVWKKSLSKARPSI